MEDFDKLWDYSEPVETRKKFEEMLSKINFEDDIDYSLQLITQIVRTFGLEGEFEEGHQLLDKNSDYLDQVNPTSKTRFFLERGRLFNSSAEKKKALEFFDKAWKVAKDHDLDYYAVDAAHMKAIAISDKKISLNWNLKALEYAEQSDNEMARKWLGSLYNNIGWTYHEMEEFERALKQFEKAYQFHRQNSNESNMEIARWAMGRVHRSLKNFDMALKIQLALKEKQEKQAGEIGPYVAEELGELYKIREEEEKSKQYFTIAYEKLKEDPLLTRNEPDRIERLKRLSNE